MELQGKIIHFLGDSITEGVGVSHPSKIYHALLKEAYGLKAANNYGISGTCLADRRTPLDIESFNRHFVSRVEDMDPVADVIVVFGGTNDFGHGEVVMGSPNDRTPDTFYGACHHLYRTLIDKYPTIPIVIMTPLHRATEDNKNINGVTHCKFHSRCFKHRQIVFAVADAGNFFFFYSKLLCKLRKGNAL